jgi:hypothetical protein
MEKAVVQIARQVTIQMVTIRRVLLVVLAPTAIKCFNLRMSRAKHAHLVGIPRPKGCQAWTIATNARRERKTHTQVPLWVAIVRSVLWIQNRKLKDPRPAFHVRKAVLPRKEVLRAPIVWPANWKKTRAPAKRFVPLVHRAATRTDQTCKHASSAQLAMLNLLGNKRRVMIAMLEHLAKPKVSVQHARLDSIKIPKEK